MEDNKFFNNNSNDLLKDVVKKLEKMINDINDKKEPTSITPQINEIITTINDIINDNKANMKQIQKEFNNIVGENKTKTYKNGKYKGEFKNDLKDGKGTYFYTDENRYEGEWKNDLKEGKGTFFWKNGNRYEGEFKNNKMEGRGIFYYNDGDKYEGDWKNDLKQGKGIFYYNNGDREMGDFMNGNQVGKHVTLHNNGKITFCEY